MIYNQEIQTKGEELLFERIRFFNQNFTRRINADNNYDMRGNYLPLLKPLTKTGDGSEWLEQGTDVFCLMLSRALEHENDLIKKTADGVIKILQEKKYRPEWIKEAYSYDTDMSGDDNVYGLRIPEPEEKYDDHSAQNYFDVSNLDYARAVSDYLFRLSTKGYPQFIGGKFFEREIFFKRLRRQQYDATEDSNSKVRDLYLQKYRINYEFLNSQGIIKRN